MKEGGLVTAEGVDNGDCGSTGCRKQLLVRLEEALIVLKVGKIVIVEGIRSRGIEICNIETAP